MSEETSWGIICIDHIEWNKSSTLYLKLILSIFIGIHRKTYRITWEHYLQSFLARRLNFFNWDIVGEPSINKGERKINLSLRWWESYICLKGERLKTEILNYLKLVNVLALHVFKACQKAWNTLLNCFVVYIYMLTYHSTCLMPSLD